MGKLKNFFFEENEMNNNDREPAYYENEEESYLEDVNTEGVTQDHFVRDVYDNNELSDMSRSIFKVEELINSLPKEMPTKTKKSTVNSILNSFGLSVSEVLDDALKRTELLESAVKNVTDKYDASIAENEMLIEAKKKEIADLEKDIAEKQRFISDVRENVEAESSRIDKLATFIGQEEV